VENNSKAKNGGWKIPVCKIPVQVMVGMENAGLKIASKSGQDGK